LPHREKIQIQPLENELLSLTLKKETINSKIDKQLNLMNLMKTPEPLNFPKKMDREVQTEEIFFSL